MSKTHTISEIQARTNLTSRTVEEICNTLNEINENDPTVLINLINYRIPCNKELAGHPTVQVGRVGKKEWSVGFLGILNGLFGINEDTIFGHITMIGEYDPKNEMITTKIIKFVPTDHEKIKKLQKEKKC